jgi:hypothetical protein
MQWGSGDWLSPVIASERHLHDLLGKSHASAGVANEAISKSLRIGSQPGAFLFNHKTWPSTPGLESYKPLFSRTTGIDEFQSGDISSHESFLGLAGPPKKS